MANLQSYCEDQRWNYLKTSRCQGKCFCQKMIVTEDTLGLIAQLSWILGVENMQIFRIIA